MVKIYTTTKDRERSEEQPPTDRQLNSESDEEYIRAQCEKYDVFLKINFDDAYNERERLHSAIQHLEEEKARQKIPNGIDKKIKLAKMNLEKYMSGFSPQELYFLDLADGLESMASSLEEIAKMHSNHG